MKLKINGTEYQTSSAWQISEKVGNPTSSAFSVLAGQELPHAGDVVQFFTDEDECLFFGVIGIPKSPQYSSEYQSKLYSINCTNGNAVLQRRLVNMSYTNKTMTEIVQDLFDRYISQEGITLGTISEIDNPVFEKYNCKNMNLLSVLNELAGYINAVWQVTNDKVFNFVKIEDFPRCSQPVTLENASFGKLQWTEDAKGFRTNQVIDGAFITTDPQTEDFEVTEGWGGFTTVFPIVAQPTILINGTAVDPSEIGVLGMQEGDNILFYWAYNSREVMLNQSYTGSTQVSVGDTVRAEYVGQAPIRYEIVNTAKVEEIARKTGLSGLVDDVYTDPTITTRQDAVNKANALLLQYGEPKNTLKCVTDIHTLLSAGFTAEDIELYRQWTFDLPELGITGEFVITERVIEPLRYNEDESIKVSLVFSDRNFIQSYGETISRIYQDFTKLSVREDETIIYDSYTTEYLGLSEDVSIGRIIPLLVADIMRNGQIAQPLGTIMPNLVVGGEDWRSRWTIFATTVDEGVVCSPYLGEEQYACTL